MAVYEEDPIDLVRWALSDKATSTLAVRVGPIINYLTWARAIRGHEGFNQYWPPGPAQVMAYLKERAGHEASPSKAASLMEALNFLHFVLGFNLTELVGSRILAGFAAEQKE
eukprot:1074518-Karenia_brevis.AAC.1